MRVNTRYINSTTENEDVPLVEFMYVVFTRMPGENSGLCCCICVTSFER